ncbi:MAG TPA: hypothetical protein VHZ50_16520 [Puia sp.]|jgi:hypothetical protein|nr:hypothetical protein [Puia sp.]
MKTIQCWRLKTEIANEANSTEYWAKKNARHKQQKISIKKAFLIDKPIMKPPFTCILTRIAPRQLDFRDNLPMSMKWVFDAICDWFYPGKAAGRADDTKEITCEYKQEKGRVREYGLRIEIIKESNESSTN